VWELQNAKCLWLWSSFDLWPKMMTNCKTWMLGSRFTVVTIISGLNCPMKNVSVIIISIISVPFLCFWSVCPTQGCVDILAWMFCHNSFGGVLSFNIQNAIIGVWSFIIMLICKSNCCLNSGLLPLYNLTCGQVFNMWPKIIHWSYHNN
jgi:hypothetical protein